MPPINFQDGKVSLDNCDIPFGTEYAPDATFPIIQFVRTTATVDAVADVVLFIDESEKARQEIQLPGIDKPGQINSVNASFSISIPSPGEYTPTFEIQNLRPAG